MPTYTAVQLSRHPAPVKWAARDDAGATVRTFSTLDACERWIQDAAHSEGAADRMRNRTDVRTVGGPGSNPPPQTR